MVSGKTVPSEDGSFCVVGVVESLEINHVVVEQATRGMEVCVKIDAVGGDKKMVGRHFEVTDILCSKISRDSIDACKVM